MDGVLFVLQVPRKHVFAIDPQTIRAQKSTNSHRDDSHQDTHKDSEPEKEKATIANMFDSLTTTPEKPKLATMFEEAGKQGSQSASMKPVEMQDIGVSNASTSSSPNEANVVPVSNAQNAPESKGDVKQEEQGQNAIDSKKDEKQEEQVEQAGDVKEFLLRVLIGETQWGRFPGLEGLDVESAFMSNEAGHLITFPYRGHFEELQQWLYSAGVGRIFGSMSVIPLEVCKVYNPMTGREAHEVDKNTAFADTTHSRIFVEQVRRKIQAGAAFSFDFLALMVTASVVAAVGLGQNNTVVVVASMLVSPLMGPILALTLGTVMRDTEMFITGLVVSTAGLLICVVCGFFVGLIMSPVGEALNWPTNEMQSRGEVSGLIFGIAIAVPSGLGVALSVLGNNTSSLVGVAISASLLPPAVNMGLCLAFAVVGADDPGKFVRIGAISFSLTLLNIACVYVTAVGMFIVKRVLPIPGKSEFYKYIAQEKKSKGEEEISENDRDRLAAVIQRRLGVVNQKAAGGNADAEDAKHDELPNEPVKMTRSSTAQMAYHQFVHDMARSQPHVPHPRPRSTGAAILETIAKMPHVNVSDTLSSHSLAFPRQQAPDPFDFFRQRRSSTRLSGFSAINMDLPAPE